MRKSKIISSIIILTIILISGIIGIWNIVNAVNCTKEEAEMILTYATHGMSHNNSGIFTYHDGYEIYCTEKGGTFWGGILGNPEYYFRKDGIERTWTSHNSEKKKRRLAYLIATDSDTNNRQDYIWNTEVLNEGDDVTLTGEAKGNWNSAPTGIYNFPSISIDISEAKSKTEGENIKIGPIVIDYSGGIEEDLNRTLTVEVQKTDGTKIDGWTKANGTSLDTVVSGQIAYFICPKSKLEGIKEVQIYAKYDVYEYWCTWQKYTGTGYNGDEVVDNKTTQELIGIKGGKYNHIAEKTKGPIKLIRPRLITTKYIKNIQHKNGENSHLANIEYEGNQMTIPNSWNSDDWGGYNNLKPTVTVDTNKDVEAKDRYNLIKQDTSIFNISYGDVITYNIRVYNVGNEDIELDITDLEIDLNLTNDKNVLKKEGDSYYIYDTPSTNLEFVDINLPWEQVENHKWRIDVSELGTIGCYDEHKDEGIDGWSNFVSIKFKVKGEENLASEDIVNNGENGNKSKRQDTVRKFLYSFTQKNAQGEEQTWKLEEPKASVNTKYPVEDERRFIYTLAEAPNMTLMDGDTVTYCIRYYSIGENSTYLSYSIPDKFGEGLQYVKDSAIRQDGSPIGVTQTGNTLQIDPPNVKLEGYSGGEVPHYDIYLTFKVNLPDPSKVPLLINEIIGNEEPPPPVKTATGYEIKGKVFIDELDPDNKTTSARNALYKEDTTDKHDKPVEGIKVELLEVDGKTPAIIQDPYTKEIYDNIVYTDENGDYTFTHLRAREITIEADGTVSGDIDVSRPYIIRFTYNGQVYENVQYGKEGKTNASYSTEYGKNEETISSAISRNKFNEKFSTINGDNSSNYTILDSAGNYKPNVDPTTIYAPGATKDGIITCPEIYLINAYSGQEGNRNINVDTAYREYVNLGVLKREFDLSLENKLDSMDISINGVNQTLYSEYGGIITETITNQDVYFKESDYKYQDEDKEKELSVWVNYKIIVSNNTNDFIGYLNSLNFYYDAKFDKIEVNCKSLEPIYNGDVLIGQKIVFQENAMPIKFGADNNLTIDIKLHLSRETIEKYINEAEDIMRTFETIAEIESYSTEYNGEIYNNGHTGIAGKIDEDSDAGNLNIQQYIDEVRSSTDPKTILSFFNKEDDAKRALGIKLEKDINDNEKRKLTGIVFEDVTEKTNKDKEGSSIEGNTRLGDGEYKKNEDKMVEGATVELYEGENRAQVYIDSSWEDATTKTDEKGNYKIEGFIPSANYIIKITYGDGNTTIYNAQDYKSTIDVTEDNYKEPTLQGINAPNSPDGKEYWYEHQNVKYKSVAKDENMKMADGLELNNESATYLETYSNAGTTKELKDKQANDYFKNTAKTAKIFAPIRWLGNTKTNSESYEIQNINLGLAERPRAELTLTKEVDHISIVATDGSTIVDGTVEQKDKDEVKSISWTSRYVQPIIDENLIYGSTMKVTYKFKIENTGEVDYYRDESTRDFYDYGIKLAENYIVTTQPTSLVDYVDNKLIYDENTESYNAKKNSEYWEILQEDERNKELPNKYSELNTILKFKNDLKELKPGEGKDYIAYLTFEKVLSDAMAEDLLTYNNYAEITGSINSAGRRSYSTWKKDTETYYLLSDMRIKDTDEEKAERGIVEITNKIEDTKNQDRYVLTIPGNLNPVNAYKGEWSTLYEPVEEGKPHGEPDTDQAQETQIIQPFGASTSQKILIWTITGVSAGLILSAGIYLIKKKVL